MKAIVTGSSRGLGLEIARSLRKLDADVAITSRSQDGLHKALESLKEIQSNSKVAGKTVDFSQKESIDEYVSEMTKTLGGIDILVNNVGIYFEDFADEDIEENLEKILSVNLMSSVRMNNAILPFLKNQKSGQIIHVISIVARQARADAATYSISKIALKAYNDLLREEVKKYNVKVLALYPGAMNTSSWDGIDVDHSKLIQMTDMSEVIGSALKMSENTSIEEVVINTVQSF